MSNPWFPIIPWIISSLLLSGGISAGGEVFTPVAPAEAGLEGAAFEALDRRLAADVADGKIAGCLAVLARGDQVVYAQAFGSRNRETGAPMTEDTIFRIYSMSKPITSVAAMMLVEEGKVALDEPVGTYLPELATLKVLESAADAPNGDENEVPAQRPMTVRDLLRHTSGLTYGFFGDTAVDRQYQQAGILSRDQDLAEMVGKLSKIPLLHQPGTKFHYSVSTDVLGRVVEVASGQPLDQFFHARIFEPLKMDDTFFTVPEEKRDRLAQMYRRGGDGKLTPSPAAQSRRYLEPTKFFSGGGGLCSTAEDYLRFCRMLLQGGELDGVRLLQPETIGEMTRNQLPEGAGDQAFGLGFSLDPNGDYGWGGAAGTRFWINPERKVIGIFMIQINPYQGASYQGEMKRAIEAALPPAKPSP